MELYGVFDPEACELIALYEDYKNADQHIESFLGGIDPIAYTVIGSEKDGYVYVVTGYENIDMEVYGDEESAVERARSIYRSSRSLSMNKATPDVLEVEINSPYPPKTILKSMAGRGGFPTGGFLRRTIKE